jgi:ribosome maturation factor RimP
MGINIDKKIIEEKVLMILNKYNLGLYEINFLYEFENDIIQVLLESKDDSTISFDDLAKVNDELSTELDNISDLTEKYILEVSSAGIERQIKTEEQLNSNVPGYVYVEYVTEKKSGTFTGDLVEKQEDKFFFKFFDKGQPKKLLLAWNEIKFIRHAVNFKNI